MTPRSEKGRRLLNRQWGPKSRQGRPGWDSPRSEGPESIRCYRSIQIGSRFHTAHHHYSHPFQRNPIASPTEVLLSNPRVWRTIRSESAVKNRFVPTGGGSISSHAKVRISDALRRSFVGSRNATNAAADFRLGEFYWESDRDTRRTSPRIFLLFASWILIFFSSFFGKEEEGADDDAEGILEGGAPFESSLSATVN